jgi:hypothetical protein
MSRLNERDIARELAESESFEPPTGLLEKIKAEIPQEVRVGTAVPGTVSRSFAPRQRWLIAASLVATVGATLVGVRTWESREAARLKVEAHVAAPRSVAAKAPPPAAPAVPAPPPPPSSKADESHSGAPAAKLAEVPVVAPAPAPKPEPAQRRALESLGYLSNDKQRVQQPSKPVEAVEVPENQPAPSTSLRGGRVQVERDDKAAGAVGGTAGAAPAAPAAVAESPAPRQKAVAVERLSLNQAQALKKEKDQEARRASATRFELAGSNPFVDAITHPVSTFGLDVDTASYTKARRVLMEGRLPDPASVRVEEWLSAFDFGGPAPVHGDFAIRTEGSLSPFSHGPEYRLLRFNVKARLQTVARNAKAQVEFNSVVVARYRLLGDGLYEIELRKDTPHWEQQVATLRLYYQMPGSDATTETIRRMGFQDFAPAWEQVSPALRLATLVAELAEILKAPWEKKADLDDVARRLREVAPQFPGNEKVAELAELAARAARLKASRVRPEE